MKLNLTFVPFSGPDMDKELKLVAYGDKDAVCAAAKAIQEFNFCINVYMTEENKEIKGN